MAETQQAGATGDAGRQEIAPRESEDQMEERLTLEEQGEAARVFVAGLLEQFGVAADVGTRTLDEETVEVTATGSDLGLLVGPRGATLAAVQDLARTVVQRQSVSRTDRILVDIGGYREKRSAALRRFTQGVADEVLASGTERALEPMSAADRKVVHDTANEIDGVQTRSEGEEPRRYIVIELAD
ncbi:MAG: single-stranded DNA-binding protein [Actinomycetota bacterium]|nr:single-stranded DNA-binding protein [Actinomycetota bacterium]